MRDELACKISGNTRPRRRARAGRAHQRGARALTPGRASGAAGAALIYLLKVNSAT
jgi:hypothetical protein